ncbi:DUF5919 domain-containing protein [Thermomonospora amylolytica]|uniref:DUF5919 domain-containing protein n=1 Tax=Thermomonospora amylolytica TaxID=1411117 RepID=UPI000E6D4130|nr:DUF5919 domain-containing protein [Thermomonospora amylolytica]
MPPTPILLKVLLEERRLLRYGMFCAEYNKAARTVDPHLVGAPPSRAQFHRWTTGELRRLPNTDNCRVLEAMFPGWTADQLFAPCPPDRLTQQDPPPANERTELESRADHSSAEGYADVTAVFPTRAEFTFARPTHTLFDQAKDIRAAGLSLNLLCQQYPDQRLHQLITGGTTLRCLFLDPEGEAIRAREQEEGYTDHHLVTLTRLNIEVLTRLRKRLPAEAGDRLEIAVYDETIRFNITLIDNRTCIMQPYLPHARGVESPTFIIERQPTGAGLYATFEQVFNQLWERSTRV